MITQHIKLSQKERAIVASVLNKSSELAGNYKASEVTGLRVTGELVQVRVTWRDRVYVFPFDKGGFREQVIATKQVLALTEVAATQAIAA